MNNKGKKWCTANILTWLHWTHQRIRAMEAALATNQPDYIRLASYSIITLQWTCSPRHWPQCFSCNPQWKQPHNGKARLGDSTTSHQCMDLLAVCTKRQFAGSLMSTGSILGGTMCRRFSCVCTEMQLLASSGPRWSYATLHDYILDSFHCVIITVSHGYCQLSSVTFIRDIIGLFFCPATIFQQHYTKMEVRLF